MDEQTALLFGLQLVALFSIAGALLAYLLCKIRTPSVDANGDVTGEPSIGAGRAVVITSADTAIGLQLALHLSNRGFRVFAGVRDFKDDSSDSVPLRVLRSWQKMREAQENTTTTRPLPNIVVLHMDVTREDIMHDAVDVVRAHLPAGEDGVWAVINTSSISYRGRLEQQDVTHWEAMLRTNVVGLLRTARTFTGLLRGSGKAGCGRLITVGPSVSSNGSSSAACLATRHAVQGASQALANELKPSGINVVTLMPEVGPDTVFAAPRIETIQENETTVDISGTIEFQPKVLTSNALHEVELAVTAREPKQTYTLSQSNFWSKKLGAIKHI